MNQGGAGMNQGGAGGMTATVTFATGGGSGVAISSGAGGGAGGTFQASTVLPPRQRWTVLGEVIEAFEDQGARRPVSSEFGTFTFVGYWIATRETIETLVELSPTRQHEAAKKLRQARRGGKAAVVKGVVTNNPRRGPSSRPVRKNNVADLLDRSKRLVVQISAAIQDGEPTEGQMNTFTQSYAELQAELNDVIDMIESVKENLSIGRAIVFDYSDPRSINASS